MKVISTPTKLRVVTAMMALWIPIAALEVIIISRAPWWNLPWQAIQLWTVAATLLCVPLALSILAGKRWSLYLTGILGALWCVLSGWIALRNENPSLGFFTLLLILLWLIHLLWIHHEMGRSYLDPHLPWFQGLPQAISGLECELNPGAENSARLRASRLDLDGVFAFSGQNETAMPALNGSKFSDLIFRFKDREVRCRGKIISALSGNQGFGFQFMELAPDARKELGDFIEMMRGEGYVE
jgi:hypothetical protein